MFPRQRREAVSKGGGDIAIGRHDDIAPIADVTLRVVYVAVLLLFGVEMACVFEVKRNK